MPWARKVVLDHDTLGIVIEHDAGPRTTTRSPVALPQTAQNE